MAIWKRKNNPIGDLLIMIINLIRMILQVAVWNLPVGAL